MVIVPDYRKYPEVKIDAMYKDIREAMKWAYKHANEIHGDPDMIYMLVSNTHICLLPKKVIFLFDFIGTQCWCTVDISSSFIGCN